MCKGGCSWHVKGDRRNRDSCVKGHIMKAYEKDFMGFLRCKKLYIRK